MENNKEPSGEVFIKLDELKASLDPKKVKSLNIQLFERAIRRAVALQEECDACKNFLPGAAGVIDEMLTQVKEDKVKYKEYQIFYKHLISHMQQTHKLVSEGSYLGMWISLGLAIGLSFGTMISNISLGIPIGLVMGVAIGTSMDADAKKKGRII